MKYFDRKSKLLFVGIVIISFLIPIFGLHDSLDIRFFYTGSFAKAFLESLNPEMQQAYVRQCLLDIVFIIFYSSLTLHEFTKLVGDNQRVIALLPGAFDLLETTSILLILFMGAVPANLDWLGVLTCLKWVSSVAILIWWLLLLIKRKRARA